MVKTRQDLLYLTLIPNFWISSLPIARILGLLQGEALEPGFILYDGSLIVEVASLDPQGGRESYRTTYRMDVDPRMLRRDHIRSLFVRQGRIDSIRAREWARTAGISDARLMRFIEGDGGGTWVRAVKRIGARARADVRFRARQVPDGILGHYGYDIKADGSAYVWAVMDKNSRYAVGLNVDDDSDGVFNASDNCRALENADQMDTDSDGHGNECDEDDDNDGLVDEADNCPLAANPGQADLDNDGIGDVCDEDRDGDGVSDGLDQCLSTAPSAVVDTEGCSIADRCPCENGSGWKNHGAYVRCVAKRSSAFVEAGLISEETKDEIVSAAGQSDCGAKNN